MNFNSYQLGPRATPKAIKIILVLTAVINVLLAIIPNKYLTFLMGLSAPGISHGFYWQILTNVFVITNPIVSFGFVFHLLMQLYIIWIFGTSIIEIKGIKQFIYLLSTCSILSSIIALFLMFSFSSKEVLLGAPIIIYACSMAWLILHKDAKLLFFSALPFKAKWLILGAMGLNLITLISNGAFIHFIAFVSSAIIAYFLSIIFWKTYSPFPFLEKMETFLINISSKGSYKIKGKIFHKSKIYDFKTGDPVIDDDEFMDGMLRKISSEGEKSITRKEKRRMEKISKKKNMNPK